MRLDQQANARCVQLWFKCLVLGLAISGPSVAKADPAPRQPCAVTRAPEPAFVPPDPFPARPHSGFYFGSDSLWTVVPSSLPSGRSVIAAGIRQKWPWFVARSTPDDQDHPDKLLVQGRRLDRQAPPLLVEGPGLSSLPPYSFYASILVFPTSGCWEVTAVRKQSQIRIVVQVVP